MQSERSDEREAVSDEKVLPVVNTCQGCGVCCFHMGFPTFMMPAEPLTMEQIQSNPELAQRAENPDVLRHLMEGHAGESYWHALPENLRQELAQFLETYEKPTELDGPCFWLDMETRQCKHHEFRPRVCRDFEIGSVECHEWRQEYEDQIQS